MRMRLWSEDRDGASEEWGRFVCAAESADLSMVMKEPSLDAKYDEIPCRKCQRAVKTMLFSNVELAVFEHVPLLGC